MWIGGAAVAAVAALVGYRVYNSGPAQLEGSDPTVVSFEMSPARLAFLADESGPPPPEQMVEVRPALVSVTAPPFLHTEQYAGDGFTRLVVSLQPGQLAAGKTTSEILLAMSGGQRHPLPVEITIRPKQPSARQPSPKQESNAVATDNKAGPPQAASSNSVTPSTPASTLDVDVRDIRFAKDPTPRAVHVSTEGPARNLRISADQEWIKVDRAAGRTPLTFTVSVAAGQLAPGLHTGAIRIASVEPGPPPLSLRVSVTVEPPAAPQRTETPRVATPRIEPPPAATPPVTEAKAPVATPAPIVVQQNWRGLEQGVLRIQRALQPGETFEVTRGAPGVTGSSDFPWNFNTRVQVIVRAPASVTIVEQPGAANSWNLIRLRAASPVQQIMLDWTIPP